MEVLKFKTSLKCDGCVKKITPVMDEMDGIKTWGVQLNEADKILTVSGEHLDEKAISKALEGQGFTAQRL